MPGGRDSRNTHEALSNENALLLKGNKKRYKEAMKIKNYIDEQIIKYSTNNSQSNSIADELKKYKDLLDANAITKEEFEKFKDNILKNI